MGICTAFHASYTVAYKARAKYHPRFNPGVDVFGHDRKDEHKKKKEKEPTLW